MSNNHSIYGTTYRVIRQFSEQAELGSTKAMLAELRNSIGREEFPILALSHIFNQLPKKYLGKKGSFTRGEKSVIMALQLYAIHQQGLEDTAMLFQKEKITNLGHSLSEFRLKRRSEHGDSIAFDRRFNAMITSSTIDELFQHLRHLIKIARKDIKINYAKLAEDLYVFQFRPEAIKLTWSRQYYRSYTSQQGEEINEK
ncbi:type I-E CRISPR-associated protein Cse2/CasB [Aerococcaceae bacterium DSM 111020]|nr:type I-E CRISPR-associated protein Cse2/CasB [Aerococcaceae bacterium DSM 111020]